MAARIETSLKTLDPTKLEVINESWMHSKGEETHFKVLVVSECFQDLTAVQRQRNVQKLLTGLWGEGIHSLSIVTRTPTEWETSTQRIPRSPGCKGNKE